MIAANELRIGNWIRDGSAAPDAIATKYQVEYIGNPALFLKDRKDGLFYSDVNPIPLTPEILEGAGFVNTRDGSHRVYNEFGNIFKLNCIDGDYEFTWGATPIKYVHQLQNLYFALTNQELAINL